MFGDDDLADDVLQLEDLVARQVRIVGKQGQRVVSASDFSMSALLAGTPADTTSSSNSNTRGHSASATPVSSAVDASRLIEESASITALTRRILRPNAATVAEEGLAGAPDDACGRRGRRAGRGVTSYTRGSCTP